MLSKGDEYYTLVSNKGEKQEILIKDVVDTKDTYDDFMKNAKKKKNKKETRRLKMRLHDKTIKGILSQTLF